MSWQSYGRSKRKAISYLGDTNVRGGFWVAAAVGSVAWPDTVGAYDGAHSAAHLFCTGTFLYFFADRSELILSSAIFSRSKECNQEPCDSENKSTLLELIVLSSAMNLAKLFCPERLMVSWSMLFSWSGVLAYIDGNHKQINRGHSIPTILKPKRYGTHLSHSLHLFAAS